ncbi:MAG: amino acid adenylation domain-containing protein [Methylocella sp.]
MIDQSGRILKDFAKAGFDPRRTIHSYYADAARECAARPAIFCDDAVTTYAELDHRSNQFARFLASRGVRPGSLVGLFLPRSPDAVIAMLGVLKAGAAYAPLDPAYPDDHLAFIAADAAPVLVISLSQVCSPRFGSTAAPNFGDSPVERAPRPWAAPTVFIDAEAQAIARESGAPLAEAAAGDDLAYVMHTSGTTGRPKGVMIPHRGVVRLALNHFVDLGPDEVVLQLAPLAFDASTFEIWCPLLNGAALAIVAAEHPSFSEIGAVIERRGVTTAWFTASLFHAIVDHDVAILGPLRQLIAGGDVLSPRHVRRALEALPQCRLINGYGPTENTTFTCCHEVARDSKGDGAIPIGRPIEHTRVYVLDQDLRALPSGEIGELFAAGEGMALGYLNRPDLGAEKFLPDPFSAEPGRLMYRTGDFVRQRPDGVVEFIGRVDRQVKIRGKRVELDEVEALLRRLPNVADAAAIVRTRTDGERQIAAYVTSAASLSAVDASALRRQMLDFAPDHLVPGHVIVLDALPRTPNGKVDRTALADLVDAAPSAAPHANPVTPASAFDDVNDVESTLAAIWGRLLNVDSVALDANFFDLGASSLDMMALQKEVKIHFQLEAPMTALFEFTNIRALAAYLRDQTQPAAQAGAGAPKEKQDLDEFSIRKQRQAEALKRAARRRAAPAS